MAVRLGVLDEPKMAVHFGVLVSQMWLSVWVSQKWLSVWMSQKWLSVWVFG